MIPNGVLELEDGRFEVWCNTKNGPKRLGVCKTREKARQKWLKAEKACGYIKRSDLHPNHAPIYRVESETIVLKRAVRVR